MNKNEVFYEWLNILLVRFSLDIDRTPVGTKMTGTYQVVDKGDDAEELDDAHDTPSSPNQSESISQSYLPPSEVSNNMHECVETKPSSIISMSICRVCIL